MPAEQPDHIVARIGRSDRSASTGALAAHLALACGHVLLDDSVVRRGFTYHPEISEEIPAFFLKRIPLGSEDVQVILQAGLDVDTGDEPFDGCRSTDDVLTVLEQHERRGRHHSSLWTARIGLGARMLTLAEVADPLFVARHPNQFRAVAEELVAIGAVQAPVCPMCSELDEDDEPGHGLYLVEDDE